MATVSLAQVSHILRCLLTERRYFWILAALVICGDAILTQGIVRFIAYTEIDWETYMYHIHLYNAGERDYSKIIGPTGPLVYPAGHLHIHRYLEYITNGGIRIRLAQQIYACLYVLSLTLSCAIYYRGSAPNWTLLYLPLSKRLHSVFVLRLFNDCWATVIMQFSILLFSFEQDLLASAIFSLALSVKMSILLYLPAVVLILLRRRGILQSVPCGAAFLLVQACVAQEFWVAHPWSYLHGAFEFSRAFLYKWTVNWRMVPEELFLSSAWSRTLLVGHISMLLTFGLFKWSPPGEGYKVIRNAFFYPSHPASASPISPNDVITALFTSNLIGIAFARSLHYQFYSWYAYQLPYLTSRVGLGWSVQLGLLACIEYAWNTFPATPLSSTILLTGNLGLLVAIWRS